MRKPLEIRDFLRYQYLSDVQLNPSGKKAVFTVSTSDTKENTYHSNLYVVEDRKVTQLTSGQSDHLCLWDNEESVLFTSTRDKDVKEKLQNGEELTVFYRISTNGGEAKEAFRIPLTVLDIKKISNKKYVIMVDYDNVYSYRFALSDEERQSVIAEKNANNDYEVLDELPFYGNGLGYTNKKRHALFLYDAKNNKLERMTHQLLNVDMMCYVEKENILYFSGENYISKRVEKQGIYAYNCESKELYTVLDQEDYNIQGLDVLDDQLLVTASDQSRYGVNENPMFYRLRNESLVLFAQNEESLWSSVGSDARLGAGQQTCGLGNTFYFNTTRNHDTHVYTLDYQGNIEPFMEVNGSVDCFDVKKDKVLFVGMLDSHLQELYEWDAENNKAIQLTHFNDWVFEEKTICPLEECNFENDGVALEGWVIKPVDYDDQKKYPAILDIHGGPKTVYGTVFYHEMQVWANKGYFVFFMNPRGSDGRGNDFADIRGKYGTIDYEDIMKFCDVVLERYPSIDSKHVGVTGGSYGGFMTNWIIGHTNRFKAAASQRSISNWISFAHTSDIGELFAYDQQQADTWKSLDQLWWHSPLKYADQAVTPTLFIHSNEDYRCPYSEGLQMYSALLEHGVEARLCMFKGENHDLSRSGKPLHRVKRLEEITKWMESHLNY